MSIDALIDHGSHLVLISDELVNSLQLKRRKLHEPLSVEMAMAEGGKKDVVELCQWVKLRLYDESGVWTLKTVRAVIAPSLCAPVILDLPFLTHNNIVINHAARTAIDKNSGFDLLNPPPPAAPKKPKQTLKEFSLQLKADRALMISELKMVCAECRCKLRNHFEQVKPIDTVAALRQRIEALTTQEQLNRLGDAVKTKYADVFSPIRHLDELPTDVYCRIKLKDPLKTIANRSYSTPQKYKEAWATLIQQHLDAG
jgi:hypothetical protein